MARILPEGDKRTGEKFSPVEAITAVGLVAIAADGVIEQVENEALTQILQRVDAVRELTEAQFNTVIDKIVKLGKEHGLPALINSAADALTNQSLKDGAIMTALIVVTADGKVVKEEEDFILYLQKLLGITPEHYAEILDRLFK